MGKFEPEFFQQIHNRIYLTADASGAREAARRGLVVVVVDVISMATTLEGALEAGAIAVYGASPDETRVPVGVNPEGIGRQAGRNARLAGAKVVLVGEPRIGPEEARRAAMGRVLAGLRAEGVTPEAVLPNLGAETASLADLNGRVVVAATGSGGVAFDAAFTAGAPAVTVATVARTLRAKGKAPAIRGALRAQQLAKQIGKGLAVVAASSQSLEDVLAAEFLIGLMKGGNLPGFPD